MDNKNIFLCTFETIIINIVIYIIFFTLQPNQDVYLHLNPHPLFLLCIIMGMRYGNYLGLVSALISSFFYIHVFLSIYGDIVLLFSNFANYKYLLLFLWSAVIFGTFRDNHRAQVEKMTEENKLLEQHYLDLKRNYKSVQRVQQELKKQIIESEESILHLYEIASRLETLESEEVYTETIGILSKYLRADAVSIYTYNQGSGYLRLKIRTGEKDIDPQSLFIGDSEGFKKVVFDKQVVRWSEVSEEGFPLMSAPLIKEGNVQAVVNVMHMDFDKLSEYAFQLFRLIIDWVNKALDRAIYVDGLKANKYIEGTNILWNDSFQERFKEEQRRGKEFGMEFGLLKYKVKGLGVKDLDENMKKILRTVDVVGYEPQGNILYVLLPATPADKISLVDERITDTLGNKVANINLLDSKIG